MFIRDVPVDQLAQAIMKPFVEAAVTVLEQVEIERRDGPKLGCVARHASFNGLKQLFDPHFERAELISLVLASRLTQLALGRFELHHEVVDARGGVCIRSVHSLDLARTNARDCRAAAHGVRLFRKRSFFVTTGAPV
ncbi:hypothetical protein [Ensifer sp. MJa1]|uniref:hypothetical protein n=1 Tax=Ensifer sp. MJa1 TaxID=2919888 RepID=UPI003008A057